MLEVIFVSFSIFPYVYGCLTVLYFVLITSSGHYGIQRSAPGYIRDSSFSSGPYLVTGA